MSTPQVLRIWRGNSAGGALVDFTVVVKEGQVVLDAVLALQAQQVGDLAVRWNCKAGKCGSCSAEINGYPLLMCTTRLSTLPPGRPVTVTPLRTFPLIKDLVTDVSANYEKAKAVPPFTPRPPDGTHRMAQADVGRSQEFRKCIECWLCQDVCHVIRDHQGNEPAYSGRGSSSATPSWTCTRSTPSTAATMYRRRKGWACATSPSAAPRSARKASRSPTTPSSPSKNTPPTPATAGWPGSE